MSRWFCVGVFSLVWGTISGCAHRPQPVVEIAMGGPGLLSNVVVIGGQDLLRGFQDVAALESHSIEFEEVNFEIPMSPQMYLDPASDPNVSLVVATDLLFHIAYYSPKDERFDRLERALDHLRRFKCPVVIAKIPFIGIKKGLMPGDQIGVSPQLAEFNWRVQVWAGNRPNVILMDHWAAFFQKRGSPDLADQEFRIKAIFAAIGGRFPSFTPSLGPERQEWAWKDGKSR